jgi:tRNA nucleotidyltransferase (CCA-adding enzyme)
LRTTVSVLITIAGIEVADIEKDKIIKELTDIVQSWMAEINKKRGQKGEVRVVLYGSKASRCSLKTDDIDILLITPKYIER